MGLIKWKWKRQLGEDMSGLDGGAEVEIYTGQYSPGSAVTTPRLNVEQLEAPGPGHAKGE